MKIYTKSLFLKTNKNCEFINLTRKIRGIIGSLEIREGIVNIFSRHTTMAIKINEHEKFLLRDIHNMMNRIAPRNKKYLHDRIELREDCSPDEPRNANAHLTHMLFETSQTIPISKGEIQLGRFQNVFAIEMSGPREREVIVQVIGN